MSVVPKEKEKSPKISRFITEPFRNPPSKHFLLLFFVSFFSGLLLIAIGFQLIIFKENSNKEVLLKQERGQLEQQVAYWQEIADAHPGYRDAHYRLAVLEYQLKNDFASEKQLQKVLELDPNFEQGRVLGTKVENIK